MIYIQNYTGDTAYTNADQQTKGIPLTKYKQDELGRIIGKADPGIGEFNGDGRYITFPDVDLQGKSLEFVAQYQDIGYWQNILKSNNSSIIYADWANKMRVYLVSGRYIDIANITEDLKHIIICFNTDNIICYINTSKTEYSVQSDDYPFVLNAIGWQSNSFASRFGNIKIHPKALTEAEVAEQYEKAKQIYPDLP